LKFTKFTPHFLKGHLGYQALRVQMYLNAILLAEPAFTVGAGILLKSFLPIGWRLVKKSPQDVIPTLRERNRQALKTSLLSVLFAISNQNQFCQSSKVFRSWLP